MSTDSGRPRPRKTDQIVLVDRCLSPEVAYEISKVDGLYGLPLYEHYGNEAAEGLEDVTFLAEAGQRDWAVLTQNPRMWQVPHERDCIIANHTRVFALDNPNATKTLKGLVIGRHLLSLRRRLKRRDPCFWRLLIQAVRKDLR